MLPKLPNSAVNNNLCLGFGNKKDVGVSSFVPIPVFRPSHCLHIKDKQRNPAHVEWYYDFNSTSHLIII